MKRGVFIVIDGTDGSGKKTQADLLAAHLEQEKINHHIADFPQYGKPSAYFVEQYLNGKYGSLDDVDGYKGSLFYALDRYDASFELRRLLAAGTVVIANRYVSANMGHQGAKIPEMSERKNYLEWLYQLEFEILGIPQPDVTLILHVPASLGQKLVDQKGHRAYVGGKRRDLHEGNIEHLTAAEQTYLEIAKFPQFKLIHCMDGDTLLSREDIHELVWQEVHSLLK